MNNAEAVAYICRVKRLGTPPASRYRYVRLRRNGRWEARSKAGKHLGYFDSETEAARAVARYLGWTLEELKR